MQKNSYIIANVEAVLKNKFLKIFLIVALLVFGYFCTTLNVNENYFDTLSVALTYPQFLTFCFLPAVILIDLYIFQLFEKNMMAISRFKTKDAYLKEMVKNVFFANSIFFIIMIIIVLTIFNFILPANFNIYYIKELGMNNLLYLIYILIKLYLMMIIFSTILTLLLKLINKNLVIILGVLFTVSLCFIHEVDRVVEHIWQMPKYFGTYFLGIVQYKNLFLSMVSPIIMFIIMIVIIFILYKIIIRLKKDVEC